MDLDRVQAEWVLGLFPADQIPEFAAQAMMQGFNGPNIMELVSFHRPDRHDIKPEVFNAALQEMGRGPVSILQAVQRLAQPSAQRLLRDQLSPYDFGQEVVDLVRRVPFEDLPAPLMELSERMCLAEAIGMSRQDVQRLTELAWSLLDSAR